MMFCPKCGKDLPGGTKFCGGCGEKIGLSSVDVVPEVAEETAVLQESAHMSSQPAYAPQPPAYAPQPPTYVAPQPHQQGAYKPQYGVEPLSVGNYIGTMLLLGIPFVGFILVLIWAFDNSTNVNKKNLARAILILSIIGIVIAILFWGIIGGILYNAFR